MRTIKIDNSIKYPSKIKVKKNLIKLPFTDIDFCVVEKTGYDHIKVFGHSEYLQDTKDNKEIIELSLIKIYELFINLKNKYKEYSNFARIVIFVPYKNLFDLQVIIFFNKDLSTKWFERNSNWQKWSKSKKINPLIEKFKLDQYKKLKETHYKEKIYDEEMSPSEIENDFWIYE